MNDELDDEVFARRLAATLREEQGERVPDLTAAVLARAAAGDDGGARRAGPTTRVRWLAMAAVLLLGVLTVLGVAVLQRGGGADGSGRDEAQGRGVRVVTRVLDVAKLPVDLRAVEVHNFDDDALTALAARCPRLEHLCVFAGTATARVESRNDAAVSITDDAFAAIVSLTGLRRLELVGTGHVKGTRLHVLERLASLSSLTLSMFDLDDECLQVLPRLVALRELDLEGNQGFGERGFAAIGRCVGLRSLSLAGASMAVQDAWFAALDGCQHLERVDLRAVGLTRRMLFARGFPGPRQPKFGDRGIGEAALRPWPVLRTLVLGNNIHLPATVGAHIARSYPRLRELDLRACPLIDDRTVTDVLAIGTLRRLRVDARDQLTADLMPALLRSRLEFVDFGDASTWLTLEHAEQLVAGGKEVRGGRRDDPAFAARLRELVARHAAALAGRRPPELVRTVTELEALPADIDAIELRGLGDRAAAKLGRFAALRRVAVVRDDEDSFTVAGLAAVAALPRLEQLELNNLPNLSPAAMRSLAKAVGLRRLHVVGTPLDDDGLMMLPELPALTVLELVGARGITRDGVRSLGRCRALRELTLTNATQLTADAFAELAPLRDLEVLDLGGNPGLLDRSVMSLRELTALRRLNLAGGQFSSMALQALAGMSRLEELDLSGNANLVSSALLHVPVGVRTLRIHECSGMDAAAGALLRDRFPQLGELVVAQNAWVTDAVLRDLVASRSLQRLGLLRCQQLTNASLATIRAAMALRYVDVTGTAVMSESERAELTAARPELVIVRSVW